MKSILRALLALCLLLPALVRAQEATLIPGATVALRLSGVPADESNQISGHYTISGAGTLALPYLKSEVKAAGMKATELAARIAATYKAAEIYTNPNIVILPPAGDPSNGLQITVGGEVRQPRSVSVRPGLDVFSAITECGGPTEWADMRKVKLLRGTTEQIIDLRKINAGNKIEVKVGDTIIVPQS